MLVRDIMTRSPLAVPGETQVGSAIALLEPLEIRHLPVIDAEGNLVGIVGERDLHSVFASRPELAGDWAEAVGKKLDEPISKIMVAPVVTVEEETDVRTAIAKMTEARVSALPVVRGTKLVGILSYVDLLKAFGKARERT